LNSSGGVGRFESASRATGSRGGHRRSACRLPAAARHRTVRPAVPGADSRRWPRHWRGRRNTACEGQARRSRPGALEAKARSGCQGESVTTSWLAALRRAASRTCNVATASCGSTGGGSPSRSARNSSA
jgi:hypothetical protein